MRIPSDIINCRDVKCDHKDHREQIDLYVHEVLEAVSDSGRDTIPMSHGKQSGRVTKKKTAGWKEFVEPYQDNAHFWHSVWMSAGKPVNTELHRIMKQSKNKFHYQIRRCKRIESFL